MSEGSEEKHRLLLMRNPWGSEWYEGSWSDNWTGWDDHVKGQVRNIGQEDDGLFYMDLDSYLKSFAITVVNEDTSNWHFSYFLMEGDPVEPDSDGLTKHSFTVTNTHDTNQNIWVGSHVWPLRAYTTTGSCNHAQALHQFFGPGISELMTVQRDLTTEFGGDMWHLYHFDADETKTFEFHGDWADDDVAKDFSVTVWGTCGPATVVHDNGYESAVMPNIRD